jgi:hypothetical protein
VTGPARREPCAAGLLEPRHWQLLWLMGTANFFAGYDFNIVIVALPQLRASYHLSQAHASLWIGVIYLGAAPAVLLAWPTGSAFGVELFPTALRALGSSAANLAMVVGQVASFVLAAALIGAVGNLSRAILVLALGPLLAAVLIATRFPETAGAELEAITPAPSPQE